MAATNGSPSPTSGGSARPFPSAPVVAPRLIVFTRFPEPGKVKTRLIGRLGAAGAADLHRELTAHALGSASVLGVRSGIRVEVRFDGGSEAAMRSCFGGGVSYRPQGEGDLGTRMARSVGDALDEGAPQVVVIGSDCPGISPEFLGQAFNLLAEDSGRVVLGPALDGGYYLVGMSRRSPELFRGIAWGTEHVFLQTEAAARESGYSIRALEPLADVDRPEDLHVWYAVRDRASAGGPSPRLSVIIPALDEEEAVAQAVDSALATRPVEVIVADGGSRDRTAAVAASRGASVVRSPRGRAAQMNAGAGRASGEVLVFLHADSVLPPGYDRAIARTLELPGTVAGAFRLAIGEGSRSLRVIEALAHWRSTVLGMPYGDQTLFLTADVFRRIGGFPPLPIMEDFEMNRRLRPLGRIRIAPEPVVTSARRWREGGVWKTTLLNQLCLAAYLAGVPADRVSTWRGTHSGRPVRRDHPGGVSPDG